MGHDGNPILVYNLGKGRPIMHTHPVDDGNVWTHIADVLHKHEAACEIAAIQPEGMEYVTTAFLAHLVYGHFGDAAMKLIAQAPMFFGDVVSNNCVIGLRHQCEGCYAEKAPNVSHRQGTQKTGNTCNQPKRLSTD